MMVKDKKTMGRQKIEIKPIQNEEARQVCFSKRRQGLFKKASEISVLCGAEVAAVFFSPGGRSFSFGHPSVHAVADRFLAMGTPNAPAMGGGRHDSSGVTNIVHEMNLQHAELQQLIEAEKKRNERLQEAMERERGGRVMQWLTNGVDVLGLDELEEFHKDLAALDGTVNMKVYQVLQDAKQNKKQQPQPHMDMASTSQFLVGGQGVTVNPMYATVPGSSYGLLDGVDVNSMLSGVKGVGGSRNCLNGQFDG